MPTTLNFKDIVDLPEWRPLANAPGATGAGTSIACDLRNNEDRHPEVFVLRSASVLEKYSVKNDEWMILSSPSLAGTFGAGAGAVFYPSGGPRGTLGAGCTTSSLVLSTALPAAVGANQLANRGDGIGFKVRVVGNTSGSSGKTEERYIIGNTAGTTPTVYLDSALSFTPANGNTYEFLSGRVYLLNAGTTAAGIWKYYDILTNSFSGNLATTNLPATVGTDSSFVALDPLYGPYSLNPKDGFFGALTATASSSASITGQATGGDSSVLANEYRNFVIRIVEDTSTPTAVGQRRWISSHTAGPSAVYTITPNWTVTPSSNTKFVIENNSLILLFSSGTNTTYAYAPYAIGAMAADSWSASIFGTRGGNMGAGCTSAQAFGINRDTNNQARHSYIYSFRGGNVSTLDLLDIAGGSTGSWLSNIDYGGKSSNVTFTTGNCGVYIPAVNEGRYLHIVHNGTQRFLRFDVRNQVMEPFAWLRYSQGTAVVGEKLAATIFVDGSVKLAFLIAQRMSATELFQVAINR